MGNARERILASIRATLGVRGDEAGRRGRIRTHIDRAPVGIIPERAKEDRAALLKRFTTSLQAQGAIVERLKKRGEFPEAVARTLRGMNRPLEFRMGIDPVLMALEWDSAPFEIRRGAAQGIDFASVSRSIGGAAETGTMFFVSGPENPSTLNFLPDTHIVLIAAEDIAGPYEDVWARIRQTYGRGKMPRTVNLIGGPSRTADIEQTIIQGAHGPRQVFVFIAGR